MLLAQAERHVFAHGERIEQRTFLEDHADEAAQLEKVIFLHLRNLLAQHPDMTAVRFEETQRQLEQDAFAGAGDAEQDLGFALVQVEGNAVEHDEVVEGDGDVFEVNDDIFGLERFGHQWILKKAISRRVKKKFTTRVSTDAATTACVVARPTPCVPPLACRP